MSVTVYIPTPFRALTGGQARVEIDAINVSGLLGDLETRYPGMRDRLRDDAGSLHKFINVYVNSDEISDLEGEATSLKGGDDVSIIPAVAGGDIFTPGQIQRYSRHLLLDGVGPSGQRKLMEARVLLIGAGGLGSPARSISLLPASARWGSSISTRLTSQISRGRSCTSPTTSAS